MLKRILKKKKIKTNKKNQCVLCKILSKKKKTKQNQTNVNILCKPEEILSRQKKKKKKVGYWMEKGNFVQHTSSSFSLHFGDIEFWWAQREKNWAPPPFSPPPPLNQTPFPLFFSPIFHSFVFILPKIHQTKHTLRFYS